MSLKNKNRVALVSVVAVNATVFIAIVRGEALLPSNLSELRSDLRRVTALLSAALVLTCCTASPGDQPEGPDADSPPAAASVQVAADSVAVIRTAAAPDSSVTALLGPEGGVLELNGVLAIDVGPGALAGEQRVTLLITRAPELLAEFEASAAVTVLRHPPWIARVLFDKSCPVGSVEATAVLPAELRRGQDARAVAFAAVYHSSAQETLDQFESMTAADTLWTDTMRLSFMLPLESFTTERRMDGVCEALLAIAQVRSYSD